MKYAENEHEPGEGAAAVLILHNRSFQYLYPENFTIFSSFQKQVIKTDIWLAASCCLVGVLVRDDELNSLLKPVHLVRKSNVKKIYSLQKNKKR